jgi:dihydroxy-acid dehydratase
MTAGSGPMTDEYRPRRTFRSVEWFAGNDEVGLLHRAALKSTGHPVDDSGRRPLIGITTSDTDLNPCNTVLRERVRATAAAIEEAGGIALPFPTMSLGEDLMKPTAMLYRNLLAIEVEEYLRSYPLDGIVVTGNCDKSIPGALMGALSADLPTIVIAGGAKSPACLAGRALGTSDVWRMTNEYAAGRLSEASWTEFENALGRAVGACNVMGTASTMALLTEALGLMLPGTAVIPASDPSGVEAAGRAGRVIVDLVRRGMRPSDLLGRASFLNAVAVLVAVGGSTNAVVHLLALAARAGVPLSLDDFDELGRSVPVLVDVAPCGSGLIQDLHRAGGLPAVLAVISDHLDRSARTVVDRTIGQIADDAPDASGAVRQISAPVVAGPGLAVLRGTLAPDGAVIKVAAASARLLRHQGPAVVFDGYHDMRTRIADPDLVVTADSVLVMRGCGPVGGPGMPEWGMIPIPPKLAACGVTDMVRVTDARMSGTSFGTVVLHAAPEAAVGGPLDLVRDGDQIALDIDARRIDLLVDDAELAARRQHREPRWDEDARGWPAFYRHHVTQADSGCDFDFLTLRPGQRPGLDAPVVGRS